jgi:hypothetical protein
MSFRVSVPGKASRRQVLWSQAGEQRMVVSQMEASLEASGVKFKRAVRERAFYQPQMVELLRYQPKKMSAKDRAMRAAEMQEHIDRDLLPHELGPERWGVLDEAAVPKDFNVAMYLYENLDPDLLLACLASLLRSRARGSRGGSPAFGEIRMTVYSDAKTALEPYEDAWNLPWADAGVTVTFRDIPGKPPSNPDPVVQHVLCKLRAMNAAVSAASQQRRHLVWLSPGIICGSDMFGELWQYAVDLTVLAGRSAGQYSSSIMLVPVSAVTLARELLAVIRISLLRDQQNQPSLLTELSPDRMLDRYLTDEMARHRFHHRVLKRTRFRPEVTPSEVLRSDCPAGRVDSGSAFPDGTGLLDEFLAVSGAIDGVGQ